MSSKLPRRFATAAAVVFLVCAWTGPAVAQRGRLGRPQAGKAEARRNAREGDGAGPAERPGLLGGARRRAARNRGKGEGPGPDADAAAAPGTRVYDPADPLRRVYLRETGQYTGELAPGPGQAPAPAPTPTPAAAAAPDVTPTPRPGGPPANAVVTRIAPASAAERDSLVRETDRRLDELIDTELAAALRPALWGAGDRERALELARRRGAGAEALAGLRRALGPDDPVAAAAPFEAAGLTPADYEPLLRRLALRQELNALRGRRPADAPAMDEAVRRLADAATRAGVAGDRVRPVAQRLVSLTHLYASLRAPAEDGGGAGVMLGNVLPDTVFRVVRSGTYTGPPVALDAETLLVAAPPGGAGDGGTPSVGESTAARLALPLLGASGPAAAGPGDAPPAPAAGLAFGVAADAGADLTLWVLEPGGATPTKWTLRPGDERLIPSLPSAQVCYLDGVAPAPTPWRELPAGAFEFRREAGVWRFAPKTFPVTLDNTANARPFHYRIDGQEGTVPPRGALTLARPTPRTVIDFDRGNRRVGSRLLLGGKDRYAVRLDADSQGIDLFQAPRPGPGSAATLADAGAPPSPAPPGAGGTPAVTGRDQPPAR